MIFCVLRWTWSFVFIFVFVFVCLLCFCAATDFSVNKDLYFTRYQEKFIYSNSYVIGNRLSNFLTSRVPFGVKLLKDRNLNFMTAFLLLDARATQNLAVGHSESIFHEVV